jgi:hypothetical protein
MPPKGLENMETNDKQIENSKKEFTESLRFKVLKDIS